jgi:hypothetical protein
MVLVTDGYWETSTVASMSSLRFCFLDITPFQGRKVVILDADGFCEGPSSVCARDYNTLLGFQTGHHGLTGHVLTGIICRQYRKNKGRLEEYVAERGIEELLLEQDRRVREELGKANQSLSVTRGDYAENGLVLRTTRFSTTTERLLMEGTAETGRWEAPRAAPPAIPRTPYVGLRIHESLVSHLLEARYGGKKYTGAEVEASRRKLLQAPEEQPSPPSSSSDWSITLTKEKPFTVNFADHGFVMTLRIAEFTSGDNIYSAMNTTARYRFVTKPEKIVAVREGDLAVYPSGFVPGRGQQLSVRQQAMVTALKGRFAKIFPERLELTDAEPAGDVSKLGPLVATFADGASGWLVLTWRKGGDGR